MEIAGDDEFPRGRRIDPCVYRAAVHPGQFIECSKVEGAFYHLTPGKENTLLHLAAAAGNTQFVKQLLTHPNMKTGFLEATNVNGNTALHEAAQGGHWDVVDVLLLHDKSLVSLNNKFGETAVFKACEGGHRTTVKKLLAADASGLRKKSLDGRTCLHAAVIRGDSELVKYLLDFAATFLGDEKETLVKEKDQIGNTVLHLAVRRNRRDMVKQILNSESELCYFFNYNRETPLCLAIKLGFLEIAKELINCRPDSIEIPSKCGKNILHMAVEFSQVGIVKYLTEMVDLSQLINQPDEAPENQNTKDGDSFPAKGKDHDPVIEDGGDTPLHIAAKNKNIHMVELLLKIRGVNKDAVNKAGLTPLDIARENTEYHESFKIIEKLADYPAGCRPFLYSAPNRSPQKHRKSLQILDKAFSDRHNTELVMAALLATMTFTAVFTVPGGFETETGRASVPGTPLLIGYHSFKLFLIFDCVAFFLSLLVVLMWEMSSPFTTEDKMVFMCITNSMVCAAFAFTAYGFMAAVYAMVAHKVRTLAWFILGTSLFIAFCGNTAYFYMALKFAVKRARFHRLCGVPRLLDERVEHLWTRAEQYGVLAFGRRCDQMCRALLAGHRPVRPKACRWPQVCV